VTVIFMWRALLMSEEAQLAEQSRVAARAMRSAMNRQLMVAQRNLRRLARYSTNSDLVWTSVATQMVEDVSGLEAMMWLDSLGQRRAGDQRMSVQTMATVEATIAPSLAALRRPGDGRARFISLVGDSTRAVMVVPRCREAVCDDLFIGVVDSRALLGSILADTVLGFNVAIGNGRQWFRASGPVPQRASPSFVVEPVILDGPSWRLGVWPSARTAAVTPSSLSDFVLLLGIAVSVLLALALRLAQSVSQTARQDERDKIDRALQTTTDGLWEWDIITNRVTRSPQLWQRLGYASGDARPLMDDWLAMIHPQDRPIVERRLADHLSQRVDAFDASYRVRNAMGRWHDFVDRGRVVLRAPDGTPTRLLGMFADITDRRHAEESLRQAETMSTMGRLAARIAHEINNPLAGIQSAFLLIKDAIPASHPHVKYVGAIEREVARISQVTQQLYETYRPETESSHHAAVQTVVSDAVVFLEQLNRNTGVHIVVEFGGVAAVVRLSESILRQCVYNLVQNAIEASPAGATVTVIGSIVARDFVLRVRDAGPGVPLELRDRVFDPFVSTKPSQLSTGGMGLGLALVRRAVEAAGGSVEIGDAPDGGAEFIVIIPLAELPVPGVTV
jgi:signal transduction histidine kinase